MHSDVEYNQEKMNHPIKLRENLASREGALEGEAKDRTDEELSC